jgi:hypothetical protein
MASSRRSRDNTLWLDWEDKLLLLYATQPYGVKRLALRLRRSEAAVARRAAAAGIKPVARTTKQHLRDAYVGETRRRLEEI